MLRKKARTEDAISVTSVSCLFIPHLCSSEKVRLLGLSYHFQYLNDAGSMLHLLFVGLVEKLETCYVNIGFVGAGCWV